MRYKKRFKCQAEQLSPIHKKGKQIKHKNLHVTIASYSWFNRFYLTLFSDVLTTVLLKLWGFFVLKKKKLKKNTKSDNTCKRMLGVQQSSQMKYRPWPSKKKMCLCVLVCWREALMFRFIYTRHMGIQFFVFSNKWQGEQKITWTIHTLFGRYFV